jgi:biopolymer transport protein ExbD
MSMSVGSGAGEEQPMMEINTTPLIDVMLVLLIYLIISLPPATHAVKLDMPRPTPPTTVDRPDPVVIDLEIEFDGSYYWNGNPVADLATLDSYFKRSAKEDPQPELHIKPNRRVKHNVISCCVLASWGKSSTSSNESFAQP